MNPNMDTAPHQLPLTALAATLCMSLLLAALLPATASARINPERRNSVQRNRPTHSVYTAAEDHIIFGILEPAHFGISDETEIFVHPLLALPMPHVGIKTVLRDNGPWAFGLRTKLTYTYLLMRAFSRAGTAGLLPPTSAPQQGFLLDHDFMLSRVVLDEFLLTIYTGFSFSLAFGGQNPQMLDMPFLYNRFAALHAPLTGRAGLALEGTFADDSFGWAFDTRLDILPVTPGGYTIEQGLSLSWFASDGFALKGGVRGAVGQYPAGALETFLLPYLDLIFTLD